MRRSVSAVVELVLSYNVSQCTTNNQSISLFVCLSPSSVDCSGSITGSQQELVIQHLNRLSVAVFIRPSDLISRRKSRFA